jgi:uroporphyrinogen-III decarboxylase
VPGVGLKNPKGIRDITEWYISTRSRRDYVHAVFAGQTEIALANLARIAPRLAEMVDVVNICGTDFGTQSSSFCSVATFRELWMPYYRRVNDWIHKNTRWRTFKHSCGAVEKFIPSFIESGFDILNPVQCSAAGMAAEQLKQKYGRDLVFWGGGVDTQQVLPFGSPQQVREQVLSRCQVFSEDGGYVFNTVHNIQAQTPVENIVAMVEAVREFNGR